MSKLFTAILCLCTFLVQAQSVKSPDGNFTLSFRLAEGIPFYELTYKQKQVIKFSRLGFELNGLESFLDKFTIVKTEKDSLDEYWQPVMGEQKSIRNHYNELLITLGQKAPATRTMLIRFRVFNDGVGFRYEFPMQ